MPGDLLAYTDVRFNVQPGAGKDEALAPRPRVPLFVSVAGEIGALGGEVVSVVGWKPRDDDNRDTRGVELGHDLHPWRAEVGKKKCAARREVAHTLMTVPLAKNASSRSRPS